MMVSSDLHSPYCEHALVRVRSGSNHTRRQSRSGLIAQGMTRSANATAVGVMKRSSTTTKSRVFRARYRRGASWPMLAIGLADSIQSIFTGWGCSVSTACRMESACEEAVKPYCFSG